MEKTISVEEFLLSDIHRLVAGKEHLQSVFVTYNDITLRGANSDIGEGLGMKIIAGGITDSALAEPVLQGILDDLCRSADQPDLIVIYVGRRAIRVAARNIERVRGLWPDTIVIVVSCDCDSVEKLSVFRPLVESGDVHRYLSTLDCGGREALRKVFDGLVAAWGARQRD